MGDGDVLTPYDKGRAVCEILRLMRAVAAKVEILSRFVRLEAQPTGAEGGSPKVGPKEPSQSLGHETPHPGVVDHQDGKRAEGVAVVRQPSGYEVEGVVPGETLPSVPGTSLWIEQSIRIIEALEIVVSAPA
jgi:hypothetical protein